ncbi:MAG TPA: hypothetical protein DC009_07030 [Porphyromonadaceae bacterium]|nr:hypothetical protein [Porphyromonadaceae bacterium]
MYCLVDHDFALSSLQILSAPILGVKERTLALMCYKRIGAVVCLTMRQPLEQLLQLVILCLGDFQFPQRQRTIVEIALPEKFIKHNH